LWASDPDHHRNLQKQADSTLDRIHCASRRRPLSSHLAARLDLPPRGPGVSRVMGACATKPKELMDSGARSGRVSPSMIDPRTSPSPQLSLRRLHLDDPSGAPPSPGYGLHDSGEALFDTVEGRAPGTPPPPPPMYRSASLPPPPFAPPPPGAHPKTTRRPNVRTLLRPPPRQGAARLGRRRMGLRHVMYKRTRQVRGVGQRPEVPPRVGMGRDDRTRRGDILHRIRTHPTCSTRPHSACTTRARRTGSGW
jgi:hypothetical protein